MRRFLSSVFTALLLTGCASHPAKPGTPDIGTPATKDPKTRITLAPDSTLTGKVVRVVESARFVVANFPVGGLPAVGVTLDVYRQSQKVGEARVSNFQQGDNTVADIIAGDAQVGDELRSR